MGERLNRVRDGREEYTRLLMRVEELDALATRITPVLSDTPKGGGSTSKTEDTWIRLIDCKTKLAERVQQYLQDSMELENELECIHNSRMRTVMKCRYVNCMKVEEIADVMHIDLRYVYRLLKNGKEIYNKSYPEEKETLSA